MVLSILLVLVAIAYPPRGAVVLAPVLNLGGNCKWLPGRGHSDFAVNPDAQTFAALEVNEEPFPRADPLRSYPSTRRIVYLNLANVHQISNVPFSGLFEPSLAISQDGRKVVALRKGDDTMYNCDYEIWAWRPYSSSENTRDYRFVLQLAEEGPGAQRVFYSIGTAPPAISPDGNRVAGFGHRFRPDEGCKDEPWDDAVGILELDSGKVTVIPLPVVTAPSPWKYWYLGWSSDGSSLYAVLHGSYSGERPNLTLYRLSAATMAVTRIGVVPPTTMGFGPDDNLIIGDTLGAGWGPHRAFALLPIGQVGRLSFADNKAAMTFVQSLPMTEVVPEDDLEFESFQQVWVGRQRTYAEVVKRGTGGFCTVLVELSPAIPTTK